MAQPLIRKIYLYLFALIGLALVTIGGVRLVSLGLKAYIFTKADIYYSYPPVRLVEPSPIDKSGGLEPVVPSVDQIAQYELNQRAANREREAAEALAFIIVGLPLYLYHWSVIKKDKIEERSRP